MLSSISFGLTILSEASILRLSILGFTIVSFVKTLLVSIFVAGISVFELRLISCECKRRLRPKTATTKRKNENMFLQRIIIMIFL